MSNLWALCKREKRKREMQKQNKSFERLIYKILQSLRKADRPTKKRLISSNEQV